MLKAYRYYFGMATEFDCSARQRHTRQEYGRDYAVAHLPVRKAKHANGVGVVDVVCLFAACIACVVVRRLIGASTMLK